jgi:5'-deoxynucleotidase YfbR-like HD superfamily hydrolase
MACLLHDASESYISDITRPVKQYLEEYLAIEEKLANTIYEKYLGSPLTEYEKQMVKIIDDSMLYYEFFEGKVEKEELRDFIETFELLDKIADWYEEQLKDIFEKEAFENYGN